MEIAYNSSRRDDGSNDPQHRNTRQLLHTLMTELAELEIKTRTHLTCMRRLQTRMDPDYLAVLKKNVSLLVSELDILEENVRSVFGPFLQNMKDGIIGFRFAAEKRKEETFRLETRCRDQESTIQRLNNKVEDHKSTIHTLYKKIEILEAILSSQTLSATRLSATLSDTLWKLSRDSGIMEILISPDIVSRLCAVVNDSLKSFHATYYERAQPVENEDEVRKIISLIGLMMNLAAARDGRKFIIETSQGQEMIHRVVQYVAVFPGLWAKRLMLMLIFNVCIHKNGTKLVLDKRCLFEAIRINVTEGSEPVPYLSFKLLQVIVYNTDRWKDLEVALEEIPLSFLDEIEEISSDEIRSFISEIRRQYRYLEITTGKQ